MAWIYGENKLNEKQIVEYINSRISSIEEKRKRIVRLEDGSMSVRACSGHKPVDMIASSDEEVD